MPSRRPKLQVVTPSASPEEAAAIVGALERFLRETTPAVAAQAPKTSPWQRAALLEGVGRESDEPTPWSDPNPW